MEFLLLDCIFFFHVHCCAVRNLFLIVNLNFPCYILSPLLLIMPKMSMAKRLFPSFLISAAFYIFMFLLNHFSLHQNNPSSSKLVKVKFSRPDCFVLVFCNVPMQRQMKQECKIQRTGGGIEYFKREPS